MNETKSAPQALTIVGPGRVGSSFATAAETAGVNVDLVGRNFSEGRITAKVVLLCVPDSEIVAATRRIQDLGAKPLMLGHTSGATSLDPLLPAGPTGGAFSIHPLQTVPDSSTDLTGCPAAVAGSTEDAARVATGLATAIGMEPFAIAERDRATYHAAASIASNYLVTLEQAAAGMLGGIGVENPREVLAPLVRRSLSNWETRGADALTGPIVRGDDGTVAAHRAAISRDNPELLAMYDMLAERTRAMVSANQEASA